LLRAYCPTLEPRRPLAVETADHCALILPTAAGLRTVDLVPLPYSPTSIATFQAVTNTIVRRTRFEVKFRRSRHRERNDEKLAGPNGLALSS